MIDDTTYEVCRAKGALLDALAIPYTMSPQELTMLKTEVDDLMYRDRDGEEPLYRAYLAYLGYLETAEEARQERRKQRKQKGVPTP